MTTAPTPDLRTLAEAAEGNGQHIYTNPRDSNKWRENEAWHRAASPCAVLHLLDRIAELEARKPLPPTDMTPVQHVNALVGDGLTAQKVEAICAREPYAVTGVVLSQPDGRACIVNQSAVRWFHGAGDFWNLMHVGLS